MLLTVSDRQLAWGLGLAGLLPFIGSSVAAWLASSIWQVSAIYAFSYYSAVILSFLGGVHWQCAPGAARGQYQAASIGDGA